MIRVLSYGGGLDSFALLLAALHRGERPDAVCFVDVADSARMDPGEWPGTYRHMRTVVMPLCEQEGIPFVWLDTVAYPVRGSRSLFAWLEERQQIPVTGPNRICTTIAKVERFERWMADTFSGLHIEVWLGFEAGEESRAARDPNAGCSSSLRSNRFPLIEWGMCRCRCEALVREFGYPVPRKSACVFCPYGTRGDWQTFARELPGEFRRVAELERRKPVTKRGLKLSIMGYRAKKDATGTIVSYTAPPLPEYIQGTYTPKTRPCPVCGAPSRATKAVGCGYLGDH